MVVADRLGVERLHRLEAEPGQAAGRDPVLDVDRSDPAGREHPEQLGGEEVHLRPEMGVVLGVPEVVVGRRVFVLGGERDRGDDQVRR